LSIEDALDIEVLRNSAVPCEVDTVLEIGFDLGELTTTDSHCFVVRTGSLNSGNALMHSLTDENFLTLTFFSSGIKYKFVEDRQI